MHLAGLFYRTEAAQEEASSLCIGDSLSLKRNPSNEYDEFAVKVMSNSYHIGFIPQDYSEYVSTELKKGNKFRVYVSDTDNDDIPHIDIKLFPAEKDNDLDNLYDTDDEIEDTIED